MSSRLLVAIALVAVGCATASGPTDAPAHGSENGPGSERALPIPADLVPRIDGSIELGRMLYLLDKASAIGTDVVHAKVPDFHDRGAGGWLTLRDGDESGKPIDAFGVLFITREEPFRILFRIDVPLKGEPTFQELSPPKPLGELGVRMFRARKTAILGVPPPAPGRRYNPVILPGAVIGHDDAILVYLLASEVQAGEMVLGIHYRVLVSQDGTTIQQALPLSKSALVFPPPGHDPKAPAGAKPVAAMVSQILTDYPLETHVFVSLLHHRMPLYVSTRRGVWLVVGDKITLVEERAATQSRPGP
jgi:hypothetical protein